MTKTLGTAVLAFVLLLTPAIPASASAISGKSAGHATNRQNPCKWVKVGNSYITGPCKGLPFGGNGDGLPF